MLWEISSGWHLFLLVRCVSWLRLNISLGKLNAVAGSRYNAIIEKDQIVEQVDLYCGLCFKKESLLIGIFCFYEISIYIYHIVEQKTFLNECTE